MSCVIVAKKINTHRCQLCGNPIHRGDDQVRVLCIGIAAHAHFSCWIRQLREHDRPTAQVIEEVTRECVPSAAG
jgi:hypothetical protein